MAVNDQGGHTQKHLAIKKHKRHKGGRYRLTRGSVFFLCFLCLKVLIIGSHGQPRRAEQSGIITAFGF